MFDFVFVTEKITTGLLAYIAVPSHEHDAFEPNIRFSNVG